MTDRTYRVHIAELSGQPDEASYQLRGSGANDMRRRYVLIAFMLIGAAIFLLMWSRGGRKTHLASAASPVMANDAVIAPWAPLNIQLTDHDGQAHVLPLVATSASVWPSVDPKAPKAFWRSAAMFPAEACLPKELLNQATTVRVASIGDVPDRIYIVDDTTDAIDLVIEACEATGQRRLARLQETPQPPVLTTGALANLPNGAQVALRSVAIVGPGEDPSLAQNQARVLVDVDLTRPVSGEARLDWATYAPTLVLASGAAPLPSQTSTTAHGAIFRYLIELPAAPLEAVWRITPPGSAPLRWQTTLPAPPSRAEVIRRAVQIDDMQASIGGDGTTHLTATLVNQRDKPFTLATNDLVLTQGQAPVPLEDVVELHAPLEAHERRVVTLTTSAPGSEPLILQIGAARYQVSFKH